jgi:hypothetical protein
MRPIAQALRTVRVPAPVPFLWSEVSGLDELLCYVGHLDHEVAPDERSAGLRADVALGPDRFAADGHAWLTEVVTPALVRFTLEIPELRFVQHGTLRVTPDSAAGSALRYDTTLCCDHPELWWRRRELRRYLRGHVIHLTDRVAGYCATFGPDRLRSSAAAELDRLARSLDFPKAHHELAQTGR